MTPTTYIRARASPHSRYWQLGERKEVLAHIKNETFGDLLDCPPSGFSALPLNAVYRNKFTGDGKVAPGALPPEWLLGVITRRLLLLQLPQLLSACWLFSLLAGAVQ